MYVGEQMPASATFIINSWFLFQL